MRAAGADGRDGWYETRAPTYDGLVELGLEHQNQPIQVQRGLRICLPQSEQVIEQIR